MFIVQSNSRITLRPLVAMGSSPHSAGEIIRRPVEKSARREGNGKFPFLQSLCCYCAALEFTI
jgi:hypothetical protein